MRRSSVVACGVGLAVVGCAKSDSAKTDSAQPVAAGSAMATKVGETGGMSTPELVRYDPELDVFYVSNINGNPSVHDGNGFIAVVRADSVGAPARMLVEGGKNGAKLDAPKGIALAGDTLWVADIDHVRAFNRKTGAPIADVARRALVKGFTSADTRRTRRRSAVFQPHTSRGQRTRGIRDRSVMDSEACITQRR